MLKVIKIKFAKDSVSKKCNIKCKTKIAINHWDTMNNISTINGSTILSIINYNTNWLEITKSFVIIERKISTVFFYTLILGLR